MKKKIFSITLAVCLLVLSIASTTLAYFTDVKEKTNVYTSGNVSITLSDTALDTSDDATVYPGQLIGGEATVTNVGTEDAFICLEVTFSNTTTNLATLLSGVSISDLLVGELDPVADFEAVYDVDANPYSIYLIYKNAVKTTDGNKTVNFFDSIKVPGSWNNDQMAIFSGTNVTVKAYATQTVGFEVADITAKQALAAAFSNLDAIFNPAVQG